MKRALATCAGAVGLAVLLTSLWFWSDAGQAYACYCLPLPSRFDLMARSSAVFAGKVVSMQEVADEVEYSNYPYILYEFETNVTWKGPRSKIVHVRSRPDSEACGSTFVVGRDYIVYADMYQGKLYTGMCIGNVSFSGSGWVEAWVTFIRLSGWVEAWVIIVRLSGWAWAWWAFVGVAAAVLLTGAALAYKRVRRRTANR